MDLEEKNGGFVPGREKGRRFLIEQGKEGFPRDLFPFLLKEGDEGSRKGFVAGKSWEEAGAWQKKGRGRKGISSAHSKEG